MNDNTINRKSFITQVTDLVRPNIKIIIIFLAICFGFFLFYQVYGLYSSNKIKNNSIVFFNNINLDDQNSVNESILELSKENGFFGVLSKLELIQKNNQSKNYDTVINLYNELLNNKKINKTYQSAIATKASYEFIDINFENISKNYLDTIKSFISNIDDELINYQGVKLELTYLVSILNIQKNDLDYLNNNQAIELFNNIISSEVASPSVKERVNKIHEFFTYK